MNYKAIKEQVEKNTKWIRKNLIPLALGCYVGAIAAFCGAARFYEKQNKGPGINEPRETLILSEFELPTTGCLATAQ